MASREDTEGEEVIGRLLGCLFDLFGWLVIAAIMLMVISGALAMLGGACWIAFSIWKAVFSFFM